MAGRILWQGAFLEALRGTGNVTIACRAAGVSRTQAYRSRDRSKRFRRDWEEALDTAVELLEAEARRRALSGVEEPVYYKGEVVGGIRKYSDTLLIFLLKAHKPKKYRDNLKVEHGGGIDLSGPRHVTFEFVRPTDLQAETLRAQGLSDEEIEAKLASR